MTDTDRLRKAADAIETTDGLCSGCCDCAKDRATAALLRAVADSWDAYGSLVRLDRPQQAALALADTILGDK